MNWRATGDGPWFVKDEKGNVADFINDPETANLIAAREHPNAGPRSRRRWQGMLPLWKACTK